MSTPPVRPDEIIYRQVGPGGNPIYFDPNRPPPLYFALFLPGPKDSDGLSLLRARYRSEIWSAFRLETPDTRYRLARFAATDAIAIAHANGINPLNLVPSADELDLQNGEPLAHCVAREINRTVYDGGGVAKRRMKEWALAMADHIQLADIVGPFEQPTAADSYRV